ncbi:LemA family protein [Acidovorax sp. D2M1]|uniref:LemA family protein n=1 Tax=Acidovorax benzenivorans TaxID=2987520 RepID=A0ABT5S3V5_9BURK|nr:LemA family protein [Acidovorax benzenivorans]MDD2180612.1 LemA family protein [Acidovorax benzenivorans]
MLWSSPLFWIAFAIFLFWALGAYNRLMRLRSAVVQSFGSFDAHMVRLVALLGEFGAAQSVQRGSLLADEDVQALAALQGAVTQFSASLAMARARPLQGDAVAALSAAREVLRATWATALQKLLADTAQPAALASAGDPGVATGSTGSSPVVLSIWQVRWEEHTVQNEQAIRVFNEAVVQYNSAIAQFPASLLAWVFGFKAARAL